MLQQHVAREGWSTTVQHEMADMRRLGFPMMVALVLSVAPAAGAASKDAKGRAEADSAEAKPRAEAAEKQSKERAAKKACLTGDPERGVELLTDLFIDTNDPTYIFNQGRCFEQSNRYEDAIGRFREYLRKAGKSSEAEKADAEKHISDCTALLEKSGAAPVRGTSAEVAGPVPSPVPAAPVVGQAAPVPVAPMPPSNAGIVRPGEGGQESNPGSGLRTAGLVTGAVGIVAGVAGVVFNLKYNNRVNSTTKDYNSDPTSRNYLTLAIVSYSAGAVCLAGGTLMYLLGWHAGRGVVGPTVMAGGAGAAFSGPF
jgi:hypothetical protein